MEGNKNFSKTNGFIGVKMKSEKGIALLTTLILGLVALTFIGALLYMLSTGTKMSGIEKRYTTALDAAKGGAELVITKIENDNIRCGGGTCTPCPVSLNNNCKLDLQISTLGGYTIESYLRGEDSAIYGGTQYKIYAILVIANNPNTNENAKVEFVYRIEQ